MYPTVYIIIINWNGYNDTVECLDSLTRVSYPNFKVILIDNNPQETWVSWLSVRYPWVEIIQNQSNLGFTGANNVGIKHALGEGAELILLLNNDTVVSPDFLDHLVNAMNEDDTVSIAGAVNCYYDRQDIIWQTGGLYLRSFGRLRMPYANRPYKSLGQDVLALDYVPGSSLLFRARDVKYLGYLDHLFFCQCEDLDWGLKANKLGKKVICVTKSVIYHKVSRSTPPFLSNYFRFRNTLRIISIYSKNRMYLPYMLLFFIAFVKLSGFLWRKETLQKHAIVRGIVDYYKGSFEAGSLNHLYELSIHRA